MGLIFHGIYRDLMGFDGISQSLGVIIWVYASIYPKNNCHSGWFTARKKAFYHQTWGLKQHTLGFKQLKLVV